MACIIRNQTSSKTWLAYTSNSSSIYQPNLCIQRVKIQPKTKTVFYSDQLPTERPQIHHHILTNLHM